MIGDGSNVKELGQQSSFYDAYLRQFDSSIIDWSQQGDNSVLIERAYIPEAGKSLISRLVRRQDGIGVDRLNTVTLASRPIELPHRYADAYISDGYGNVRPMAVNEADPSGLLSGRTNISIACKIRASGAPLSDYQKSDDFDRWRSTSQQFAFRAQAAEWPQGALSNQARRRPSGRPGRLSPAGRYRPAGDGEQWSRRDRLFARRGPARERLFRSSVGRRHRCDRTSRFRIWRSSNSKTEYRRQQATGFCWQ